MALLPTALLLTDCAPAGGAAREPTPRADMVLQLARGYLSAAQADRSGEDRTTVVVHVSAEHLDPGNTADQTGQTDQHEACEKRSRGNVSAIPADCCQVAGVGGIEAETAARLACDATLIGMIRGRGGAVLAHGRRRRVVSQPQRRALQVRDGGCRFPGCPRVSHLEAHHVRHWSRGGRTDMDNLILLCRFHHIACHEGGVAIAAAPTTAAPDTVTIIPDWRFTTADGEPLRGETSPDDTPGYQGDHWILWQALDGSKGLNDPEATNIRPLWAGERFSLADTVSMLFGAPKESVAAAA